MPSAPGFLANGTIFPSRFVAMDRTTTGFKVIQCTGPSSRIIGISQSGTYAPQGLAGQVAPLPVGGPITAATNATPSVITTTSAHGLAIGNFITIQGAVGATGINGQWIVATVPSGTTFTIGNQTNPGVWTSGGTVNLLTMLPAASAGQPIEVIGESEIALIELQGTTACVIGDYLTSDPNGFAVTVQFAAPITITNVSAANPATVTTLNPHGLVVGENVLIAGVQVSAGAANINGSWTVATVPSTTTFTVMTTSTQGTTVANTGIATANLWYGAQALENRNPGELVRCLVTYGQIGAAA